MLILSLYDKWEFSARKRALNEEYPFRGKMKNFRWKRQILHLSFFVLHQAKILHFARSAILHSTAKLLFNSCDLFIYKFMLIFSLYLVDEETS